MHIVKTQTDKLIVGTNDTSYTAPDTSPTGTSVLNGPVYVGTPAASPGYEAVLNVGTVPPPQNPLDSQPPLSSSLAVKVDGSMEINGDGRVATIDSPDIRLQGEKILIKADNTTNIISKGFLELKSGFTLSASFADEDYGTMSQVLKSATTISPPTL